MRLQRSALPEYCRWCSGRVPPLGERYWLAVAQGYLGPYCSREHLNFAAGCSQPDVGNGRCSGLAEGHESVEIASHDASESGASNRTAVAIETALRALAHPQTIQADQSASPQPAASPSAAARTSE